MQAFEAQRQNPTKKKKQIVHSTDLHYLVIALAYAMEWKRERMREGALLEEVENAVKEQQRPQDSCKQCRSWEGQVVTLDATMPPTAP